MYASKLTISPETQALASKPLTKKDQGRLRYEKFKRLEENGYLTKIKNKHQLLELLGVKDKDYKTGIAWLNYQFKHGYITETLNRYGGGFEYHSTSKHPDYTPFGGRNRKKKPQVETVIESKPVLVQETVTQDIPTMMVRKDGIEIELPYNLTIVNQILNIKRGTENEC